MGRAMIIICAGVLVSIGYVGFGNSQQLKQVIGTNASSAEAQSAKNAAHTVIQMAMREMDSDVIDNSGQVTGHSTHPNHDNSWQGRDQHDTEGSAWIKNVDGSEVHLWIDVVDPDYSSGETKANDFDPETIRVFSKAEYFDPVTEKLLAKRIVNAYETSSIEQYVPPFEGPLTFTNDATVSTNGSASINGNDASGTCEDKPGVVVPNEDMQTHVQENAGEIIEAGEVSVKDDLNYDPTSEMIARLKETGNYTTITDNYGGDFGSPEEPGVFFVEGDPMLTGSPPDGYGILVIQSGSQLTMEDEDGNSLWVGGEWVFNGLIIFENAYDFTGRGTPTINGSVLVGNTDDYAGDPLNVDLNGNIHLQYDCQAENYAKKAAADAVGYNRYVRLSSFE